MIFLSRTLSIRSIELHAYRGEVRRVLFLSWFDQAIYIPGVWVCIAQAFVLVLAFYGSVFADGGSAKELKGEFEGIRVVAKESDIIASSGDSVEFSVEVENLTNRAIYVLKRGERMPLELYVYDERGRYRGDCLAQSRGRRLYTSSDWQAILPGKNLALRVCFTAGRLPAGRSEFTELPEGSYYLELRAYSHLVSGRPVFGEGHEEIVKRLLERAGLNDATLRDSQSAQRNKGESVPIDYGEWSQTFPGFEVCRMERVKLTLLRKDKE